MFEAEGFDRAYYERFYLRGRTRARVAAEASRTADLIFGAARHYQIDVRRLVDLGAGTGFMLRALGRRFPRAARIGVELSPWAARRYGWVEGSLLDFQDPHGFDLVVCNDVIQYLDDAQAARAIDHIAGLGRGLLYLTALTRHDLEHTCDQDISDLRGHFRSADWYRRRLRCHFVDVGSGLYLAASAGSAVWELERR
ncbi:MAG: class I SAM-dependent methyltransferase [Pseudomonadales bacterium]|jgi:SAM-dependent methyltransferase|nr:class I SAM-dependent methyltransferase [Pseudomonadales bacterium]